MRRDRSTTTRRTLLAGGVGAALAMGLRLPASAALALPVSPKVWLFGDSYTFGAGASVLTKGYAYLVGKPLGWQTTVYGGYGSGYCNETDHGAGNYEQRIWKLPAVGPDLLVLQGTTNDNDLTRFSAADLAGKINLAIRVCQRRWPKTELLFLGPTTPYGSPNADLKRVNDKVKYYANLYGKKMIDPTAAKWFVPGDGARYAQPKGPGAGHPNDLGYQLMADRFVAAVKAL